MFIDIFGVNENGDIKVESKVTTIKSVSSGI